MNFFFNKTVITLSLWVTLYFYCTASFAQQGKDEHANHHPKNSQIASVSPTQKNIVVANNDGGVTYLLIVLAKHKPLLCLKAQEWVKR